MKNILFFLLCSLSLNAQEFSTALVLSDTLGNIDTLKIGYDISATYEVDAAFGELDIQDISFHDSLDTRLAQIDHGLYFNCDFSTFTYGDLTVIREKRATTFAR